MDNLNIRADSANEVATKGSDVILTCQGSKVSKVDTVVFWMFNGQKIQGDGNKKTTENFMPGWKGRFSLHITNVSENDFGNFSCHVMVGDNNQIFSDEDFIELSLYKKGEFHCCYFYSNIPVIYKTTLKGST